MTYPFANRFSATLSAIGLFGLLSPLVFAAMMFVAQQGA